VVQGWAARLRGRKIIAKSAVPAAPPSAG
jgi:hypothetical protein